MNKKTLDQLLKIDEDDFMVMLHEMLKNVKDEEHLEEVQNNVNVMLAEIEFYKMLNRRILYYVNPITQELLYETIKRKPIGFLKQ